MHYLKIIDIENMKIRRIKIGFCIAKIINNNIIDIEMVKKNWKQEYKQMNELEISYHKDFLTHKTIYEYNLNEAKKLYNGEKNIYFCFYKCNDLIVFEELY